MKDGLYTRHEVACIIADLFGDSMPTSIRGCLLGTGSDAQG